MSKAELRERMNKLFASDFKVDNEPLLTKIESFLKLQTFDYIVCYYSIGHEVNLSPLFSKFSCLLPVYNENDGNYCLGLWDGLDSVHVGKYGIKEPKLAKSDSTLIDKSLLWLVPGIAFDEHGRRLGRGGGFYDRLLNKYSGIPVGICAEEQLVSGVPFEEHDKKMKFIITPERVINC